MRGRWLASMSVMAVACAPEAAPRAPAFGRATVEQLAADPGALRAAVDPGRGVLLVEHYEGGDHQHAEHLCGAALEARLPELARQIADDRERWDLYELTCAAEPPPPACTLYPGEAERFGTRYLFVRKPDRFVLEAIVRFQAGAMDTTAQDRFIDAALARGRATRCP